MFSRSNDCSCSGFKTSYQTTWTERSSTSFWAMTSTKRKRSVDELLNDDASPPTSRRKLDNDIPTRIHDFTNDRRSDDTFLAYPDLSNHNPVSVPFQQPTQLISFSYDASHTQEFDDSALRYFVHPRSGVDLSYGYDRWIKRPDERGRIDALLKAISKAKKDGIGKGVQFPGIGVVSWRGIMTKYVSDVHFF